MSLLSVEDALDRILDSATPRPLAERVDLHDAVGRVLAEDISALVTHPAFDNSAMDGYAVRHQDIETAGAELIVIGQSAAGHGFKGEVGPGEAVRIFTGAPCPPVPIR